MLSTRHFGDALKKNGFDFYSGVPCSFLKDLINYAVNFCTYVPAANEGDATAICAGAYIGGKKPVVLMQNSGLTNAVSPLTSLNYVFHVPLLGFVSLRGEEGIPDEPQHELMGRITTGLLDLMEISWEYLSSDMTEAREQLGRASAAFDRGQPFFFVVRKNTFDAVPLSKQASMTERQRIKTGKSGDDKLPLRIDALKTINALRDKKTVILATTGYTGRELYTVGDADTNLYLVGSMGCIGPLGLGLSLARPDKDVIIIDGDGSLLMRMGSLAVNAHCCPENMFHLLLDNSSYESTGGQPAVSMNVDFVSAASSLGYPAAYYVHGLDELSECIRNWKADRRLTFACLRISTGTIKDLARPTVSPGQVRMRLMRVLNEQ